MLDHGTPLRLGGLGPRHCIRWVEAMGVLGWIEGLDSATKGPGTRAPGLAVDHGRKS
jgi:hypothetical protein